MKPNQIKTLAYVDSIRLVRNNNSNMVHAITTWRGYRINDTFSAFRSTQKTDPRYGKWELIHNATMSSVATFNTLRECIVAAYAFLPYDMQYANNEQTDYGTYYNTWNDDTARENARQTWLDLHESVLA